MISIITVPALLMLITIIIFLYNFVWTTQTQRSMPPEPKGAWPIIGHLHLLGGENQLIHHLLGSMADTYGPAFTIRIGLRRALVVSSWEVARDCFTTNDRVFATRPSSTGARIMGYDTAMFGLAPYGPYWREIRKIATLELLSNRRLEMLKHIRNSEIKLSIKALYEIWMKKGGETPVLMEMKRWFRDLSFNITVRMIAGKRYVGQKRDCDEEESQRCQKAIADFMHLLGMFVISDAIPFLGFLDIQEFEKKMKKTGRAMDLVLGKWVDEHRNQKRNNNSGNSVGEERDFIDVLLSILNDEKEVYGRDPETVVKSTCLSLVVGGQETTSVTLTWALSLLLNNRRVLEKVQAELDLQVGKDRQVEESDVQNLVYLHAIVKEVLRLYPPGQLSPPREAMEDCTVAGFYIPKGTQLMVNLWKLHRDPRVWSDPLEFRPERFLSGYEHAYIDVRGQSFELLPFGSGRRICPGISMALQVLHLALARLLHGFDMSTPANEPIDMTEASGFSCPKATPLEVFLNPRLPSDVYVDSEN